MEIIVSIIALRNLLKLVEKGDQDTINELKFFATLKGFKGDIKELINNLLEASIKLGEAKEQANE